MAVPSKMQDLSTTESVNSPSGGENPISTDNHLRALSAIMRHTNAKGTDIASAASIDIGNATGEFIDVTGTTDITSLGTVSAGIVRTLRFTDVLTLTHNATSLILSTGDDVTTYDGYVASFRSLGGGDWVMMFDNNNGFVPTTGGTFTGDVGGVINPYDFSDWDGSARFVTEDAQASINNTVIANQQARVTRFTSTAQAVVAGTNITVAHGLGEEPFQAFCYLECTTAESGYSIGDKILIGSENFTASSGVNETGVTIRFDSTDVEVIIGGEGIWVIDSSTNGRGDLTDANWDLYVRAWI